MDQPPLGDVRQVSVTVFGHTKDGTPVKAVTISAGDVTATVMEWGATLLDLRLAGVNHSLTAGFEDFATYETHGQHVGAIAGRFAGRIAGGFEIAGNYYPTTRKMAQPLCTAAALDLASACGRLIPMAMTSSI